LIICFFGTRALSSVVGFLVGSISQYALHNCPCPVAFIKSTSSGRFNSLGVFYDFSETSKNALNSAIQFTTRQLSETTIHVCVCVERPPTDSPWGSLPDEADAIEKKNIEQAEEKLEVTSEFLKEAHVTFTAQVKVGDPRSWLEPFIQENAIDVLFLGSRGHSTELSGFLVGSTSQYAMHNCTCSVVITNHK